MPHLRSRLLEKEIRKDLSWSPIVSVLGMRQVGKSTLLRQIGKSYLTLDDDRALQKLELGDWSEVESAHPPLVIDEAQKNAGLFDRVKLLVDRAKRPGQFILTGSVRFLSRKQIRESLTGRTSLLELLPLTIAEAHSLPLSSFFGMLLELKPERFLKTIAAQKHFSAKETETYLDLGGMPGICFKRSATVRERMRDAHLETLLMRDLQLLVKTRIPFIKLKSILISLAQNQGQAISLSALSRQVQLSTPSVIQMIRGFEDLFILRPHGKTWFFSDCGMSSFLGADRNSNPLFQMERFIYQELYAQLSYDYRARFTLQPYLSRGGVRIPFVVRLKEAPAIAITVDAGEGASEKSLKGLTWFAKQHREPVVGIVLHRGKSAYLSATGSLCLPFNWIT